MAAADGSQTHRGWKQVARFLEEHAGAWLHARRDDDDCKMQNGFFLAVEPTARCSWCKEEVGDDLLAHDIEYVRTMRGDNNRRHQFLLQALFSTSSSQSAGG